VTPTHHADGDPLVAVENLRFAWANDTPEVLAIDNFAIAKGERVFLRGASGSGKTTLLSLLGGVVVPDSGSIKVAGQSLAGDRQQHFGERVPEAAASARSPR